MYCSPIMLPMAQIVVLRSHFERNCRVEGLVILGTNEAQLPSPYSCETLVAMFLFS